MNKILIFHCLTINFNEILNFWYFSGKCHDHILSWLYISKLFQGWTSKYSEFHLKLNLITIVLVLGLYIQWYIYGGRGVGLAGGYAQHTMSGYVNDNLLIKPVQVVLINAYYYIDNNNNILLSLNIYLYIKSIVTTKEKIDVKNNNGINIISISNHKPFL